MSRSGAGSGRLWWVINAAILLLFSFACSSCSSMVSALVPPTPTATPDPDSGNATIVVRNQKNEELKNAVVRVTDSIEADDYDNKIYRVNCFPEHYITAWAPGYKVKFQLCEDNRFFYDIPLEPLSATSGAGNSWLAANVNCIGCHKGQISEGSFWEYDEWNKSGHASTLTDRYLETMYNGTNWWGQRGSETTWVINGNGRIRLRPTDTNPSVYFGPGFRLDYPYENGNCAYCHAPAAVDTFQTDVNLTGLFSSPIDARGEGVTCDVCHKVINITLDEDRYPYSDQPGILSFQMLPPQSEPDFTVGPFSNTFTKDGDKKHITCASIFSKSEFCAACHYGKFHDTVIYNSYGEWRASAYSQRELIGENGQRQENKDFRSCQDCHMSSEDAIAGTLPSERDACSASNRKSGNFDHNMMKFGQDLEHLDQYIPLLIKNAASLEVASDYLADSNALQVTVKVTNTKAGHKFPTDSPLRHLILVVEALDEQQNLLPQVGGDVIPVWGGVGSSKPVGMEAYAGFPGRIFANLLVDKDTNISPTAAYWNPTKLAMDDTANNVSSDTRLKPGETNESKYSFAIPSVGQVSVSVKLMYRYAFFDLALQKGWARPDIEVVSLECFLEPTRPETLVCY